MTKNITYTPQELKTRRQQQIAWLLAFIIPLSVFWTCMEWSSDEPPLFSLDDDDTEVDMELMPDLKEDQDMIAAPTPKVKEEQQKTEIIRKVDEVEMEVDAAPNLAELLKFTPIESDDPELEELKATEDVPPLVMDFNNHELPQRVAEELPEFPDGYSEMVLWISRNLRYPETSQKARQQGTVVVEFIIETDGSVSGLKVTTPAAAPLNNEALRVMKLMPKWKPAQKKGKPVRAMLHVPIVFALDPGTI